MRYICIGLLLLITGCRSADKNVLDDQLGLYPGPRIVALNTDEGYAVNQLTGDSIQPLINSLGDTVKTGVPVPARGRVLDPRDYEKPVILPAGRPEAIPANLNLDHIPGAFPSIPIDTGALYRVIASIDPIFAQQKRSEGEKESMIKLKQTRGRPVPSKQPHPVTVMPPVMKDNARTNIKYLDVEHGLSSSNLIALEEDSWGHIWIATQQKGVSMYDGESIMHFTEEEGLSSNYVTSIMEDDHGNLWFGTLAGISVYDGCSFEHIWLEEESPNLVVWAMLEDSNGDVWFGTNKGLFTYNGDTLRNLTERDGLINNHIWSVIEDNQGRIWAGTMEGVSIYNGRSFHNLTLHEGLTSNRVWCILKDRSGRIWMGTDVGVNMYDGESITHITKKDGLTHNVVRTIQEDRDGNLWFGTLRGLSKFDGGSLTHITENEGLNSQRIRAIMEDSQGNIWFGTEGGGISIYYGSTFTYFSREDGFRELGMLSFLQDRHNHYWFGAWGSGVSLYDGEYFRHFTQAEGLIQNAVFSMLEDSRGNIWFGTYDGLCKYDGVAFTQFDQSQGLSDDIIRALLEDGDGNLWIGTSKGGVNMYDGKAFTYFTESEGLVDNRIRAILEDHQGNLWFGTANGASMYNGEAFIHYTKKEGLGNHTISCMLEDGLGNIWFGTEEGGAVMFNGISFIYFTQNEGLSNNSVTSLAEDHHGQIWITTKHGLNRVVFENQSTKWSATGDPGPMPEVHAYGLMDGLKSAEFLSIGNLVDNKNRIWWGSPKGVLVLDPDHIDRSEDPPVTLLTRIDINGQLLDYRQQDEQGKSKLSFTGVNRFHNYPLDLELPYTHNRLTFYFSANDWSASQNLQYAYMMDGLDDHWNAPSSEAMADYRNITPGRYTFRVKSIGAANTWSEPFSYSFRILPPPWLKWWAFLIYTSILILMIRWYRGFLIRREKVNADLRIKDAELNKMQELDHMKSRFFANISHEFRTPLTLIQGPIEELRDSFRADQFGELQLIQTVKRNLKRLRGLINQLLDVSKLETGKVGLQVSQGDLEDFLKSIIHSFLSLAEHKKINYTYKLPGEKALVYFDADKVEKILSNLISNAFKYTPSGGEIQVDVRFLENAADSETNDIEIRVDDTGIGISKSELGMVFDRFYRVRDELSLEEEGTGLGLALTRELVHLYRGDIRVESEPGKGSTFTVTLPVSVKQFREEEIVTLSSETDIERGSDAPIHVFDALSLRSLSEQTFPDNFEEKPLILIVEDNEDLCDYISRILGASYRIICAANGRTGLEKAKEYIPDLIISDVMMPRMDGIEMCKRLNSDQRTDHIPLVILTARAEKEDKLEGLETGAEDYLIKPFEIEELQVRVKNLLERRRKLREKFRLEFLGSLPEMELPSDNLFIKRVLDLFNKNISDPDFKMPQLSENLYLSESQVRRKILALTGYSPNELLRYHRLKKAAIYFRSGHKNVAQVMYLVGFNNQSYFAKCFSKLFGKTPSQFISSSKKQAFSADA